MTTGSPPPTGSLAQEAALLMDAVREWVSSGADCEGEAHSESTAGPTSDEGHRQDAKAERPPECRLCPICRMIAMVGGDRPDVVMHLLAAAMSLVAALRAAVAAQQDTARDHPPRPTVQRIDIT